MISTILFLLGKVLQVLKFKKLWSDNVNFISKEINPIETNLFAIRTNTLFIGKVQCCKGHQFMEINLFFLILWNQQHQTNQTQSSQHLYHPDHHTNCHIHTTYSLWEKLEFMLLGSIRVIQGKYFLLFMG